MCPLGSPRATLPFDSSCGAAVASRLGGRYEVLERLGVGGMGIVSRVRDHVTQRVRAVKQPRWRGLAEWEPRFDPRSSLEREYRVLARLDHPHIVRPYDFGLDEDNEPYLVIDLVEDATPVTVGARCAARHDAARCLVEMFDAIHHVHSRGFLHRDIKPSNVVVGCGEGDEGRPARVCLIDFGLSRALGEAATPVEDEPCHPSLVGSALYLAPELIEGQPASPASDLYAAGMIAAQVLTGVDPVQRSGARATLSALRDLPREWVAVAADVLGIDGRVVGLLKRLLARDPRARCARADEAAAELRAMCA